ncbi:MAG: hypothetical protein ABFS45_01505 [Pseudomonadota bacterium]
MNYSIKTAIVNLYKSIALIVVMMAVSSQVSAGDTKIYNGYSCHNNTQGESTLYHSWGAAYNKSTARRGVSCAVVRDAKSIASAGIQVIDAHPTQAVNCYLSAITWYNNGLSSPTFVFDRTSVSSTNQYLDFTGLIYHLNFPRGVKPKGTPIAGSTYWSNYTLDCWLPGKYNGKSSAIVSYRINENN